MSSDPVIEIQFSDEFRNNIRNLSKKYRNIRSELESVLDELSLGVFKGDQIPNIGYTVFKLRIKNSDSKKGKNKGYRIIYYVKTSTSVILVTIYSKSDQSDVSNTEIQRIISMSKSI